MRRSRDTDGSPPSIFATLDWLDWISLAKAVRLGGRPARHWIVTAYTAQELAAEGVEWQRS